MWRIETVIRFFLHIGEIFGHEVYRCRVPQRAHPTGWSLTKQAKHMGTKSTKKVEPAAPAAKPAPKRKVGVRPPEPKAPAPKAVKAVKVEEKPAPAPKPAKAAKATPSAPVPAKAVKTAKPKAATPAPAKPAVVEISTEAIALRAYFISEARQAAGLPGTSEGDWIEAERQLRAESLA